MRQAAVCLGGKWWDEWANDILILIILPRYSIVLFFHVFLPLFKWENLRGNHCAESTQLLEIAWRIRSQSHSRTRPFWVGKDSPVFGWLNITSFCPQKTSSRMGKKNKNKIWETYKICTFYSGRIPEDIFFPSQFSKIGCVFLEIGCLFWGTGWVPPVLLYRTTRTLASHHPHHCTVRLVPLHRTHTLYPCTLPIIPLYRTCTKP